MTKVLAVFNYDLSSYVCGFHSQVIVFKVPVPGIHGDREMTVLKAVRRRKIESPAHYEFGEYVPGAQKKLNTVRRCPSIYRILFTFAH